jgi:hypothetical protein
MWMWIWDEAVWVCCSFGGREGGPPRPWPVLSHLHMGSLRGNDISAPGAGDLGAALRVNTTLTTLK